MESTLPGPGFRVLVLARLSKLVAGQTGIDSQDVNNEDYARQHQWEVVKVLADRVSGRVQPWDRKNVRAWMTDPELRKLYDGILVSVFDRLTRGDDASTAEIEKWARDNEKLFLTADGLYYPCEGEDGIRWDLAKRLAHAEWLRTSKRYRNMHTFLRSQNNLVNKPPWGFIIVEAHNGHKTLAVDPELKPVLIEIIQRTLRGDTFSSICRWLDESGYPPKHGGKWHTKSLTQILRNPCLKGKMVNAKGKTILRFPPLITAEKFDEIQANLANRPNKRGPAKGDTGMLTGIIRCAICGGGMYRFRTYNTHKDRSRYVKQYYRCKGTDQEPSTCRNMVPLPAIHNWLDLWLTIGASEGGAFGDVEIVETVTIPGHGHQDEIRDVEDQIRELDFDAPDFLDKQAALLAKRKRLQALPKVAPETIEHPTGIKVKDYWPTLTEQEKRQYLLDCGIKICAQMRWDNEADRYSKRPGELDPEFYGNPARVIGRLRRK